MIIGSIREDLVIEKRVALTPETAKNIINLSGHTGTSAGLFTETSEINIDWLPYSNPETIIAVIPGKKKTK